MADALPPVAFATQIRAAAARHHLDPRLLAAVAAQETGGPGARSGANIVGDGGHGHGVFQIDDRFHAFARGPQAMDPAKNADYAAGMLEDGLRRYGDVHRALSAYNAGDPAARGSVTTWGDGATLGYADSVLRHYSQLGGPLSSAAIGVTGERRPTTLGGQTMGGFNLGNFLGGALPGALTGNWPMAIAGGLQGGFNGGQTATSVIGGTGNGQLDQMLAANSQQQVAEMARQMAWNQHMQQQSDAFNEMADQKSETMREGNVLRDIAMQQRKADNAITKEFITMIKE